MASHPIATNAAKTAAKVAKQQAATARQQAAVAAKSARFVAKDDAAIGKFNLHVQSQIASAGNKAYSVGFQSKIDKEQAAFAKHHARFTPVAAGTLIPALPDGTGALVITVANPVDPLAAGVSGPVDSTGTASTFSVGSGDGFSGSDTTPAPAPQKSSSGSSGIPTWVLVTGAVVGAVGLYGYVKYKAFTAPFKAILSGVNGFSNNARSIGAGIRSLRGK